MVDRRAFHNLALARVREVARYQKAMCGKVENLGKAAQSNIDATHVHTALTYMDMFTQDYLMVPLFERFPQLVPCVEETTGMKLRYQDNQSADVLILDPIDGTDAYTRGQRDYSIMVGLLSDGELTVGLGFYPETGEAYGAIKGEGAWRVSPNGETERLNLRTCDSRLEINAHYRFLREPYLRLSQKLRNCGYSIRTNEVDFGTNLTGILDVARGTKCAFIGPHITLHDFGVPALLVQEAGGVLRMFRYNGKDDTESWRDVESRFSGLNPRAATPRFRVIVADCDATVDRLVAAMK